MRIREVSSCLNPVEPEATKGPLRRSNPLRTWIFPVAAVTNYHNLMA